MPNGQGFDACYGTPLFNGFTVEVADSKFLSKIGRVSPDCDLKSSCNPLNVSSIAPIYPARIRTLSNRIKICCATVTPRGNIRDSPEAIKGWEDV